MSGVYINFMEYPDINSLYEDQSINWPVGNYCLSGPKRIINVCNPWKFRSHA
jgi:hypothetical protein